MSRLSAPVVASPRYSAELVVSDAVVLSLSARGEIIKEFPALKFRVPIAARGHCGSCQKRSGDRRVSIQEYARIRGTIVGLPLESLGRLKGMLRVARLVVYLNHNGQVKKHVI